MLLLLKEGDQLVRDTQDAGKTCISSTQEYTPANFVSSVFLAIAEHLVDVLR